MTRRTVALCACARSPAATNKIVASRIAAARRVRRLQRLAVIVPPPPTLSAGRPCRRPLLDDGGERVEAVGQCGRPRLQNERRLDLAQKALAHGSELGEARPRRDLSRHELLAAPGADDDIGI